jgi:hypothetical protein
MASCWLQNLTFTVVSRLKPSFLWFSSEVEIEMSLADGQNQNTCWRADLVTSIEMLIISRWYGV